MSSTSHGDAAAQRMTQQQLASALNARLLSAVGLARPEESPTFKAAAADVMDLAEELHDANKINQWDYKRLCDATTQVHGAIAKSDYDVERERSKEAYGCCLSLLDSLHSATNSMHRHARREVRAKVQNRRALKCVLDMQDLVAVAMDRHQPERAHLYPSAGIKKKNLRSRAKSLPDDRIHELTKKIADSLEQIIFEDSDLASDDSDDSDAEEEQGGSEENEEGEEGE